MQPCSREIQATSMNSLLNQHPQQQSHMSLLDLQNGHHQPPHFDSPAVADSHDDFLEQILSSSSWLSPLYLDITAAATAFKPQSLWDTHGSVEDQSALLVSKLPQHQIGGANKAMILQQQLLLSRGLAAGNGLRSPPRLSGPGPGGLLPLPLSLTSNENQNDVIVEGSLFKFANSGNDASVQALFNGFNASLGQPSSHPQQFHHPLVTMSPAVPCNQYD